MLANLAEKEGLMNSLREFTPAGRLRFAAASYPRLPRLRRDGRG